MVVKGQNRFHDVLMYDTYMIGWTDNLEKPLYLLKWGVPFEALAYVFGSDPMYWYRAYLSFGRPSIVGTTAKSPEYLPVDLLADEKHSRHKGEKICITTTAVLPLILISLVAALFLPKR